MGTTNYDFTYIDGASRIDVPGDTKVFLDEIDAALDDMDTTINTRIDTAKAELEMEHVAIYNRIANALPKIALDGTSLKKTIYVDYQRGFDAADGSVNAPMKTIVAALKKCIENGWYNIDMYLASGTHHINQKALISNLNINFIPMELSVEIMLHGFALEFYNCNVSVGGDSNLNSLIWNGTTTDSLAFNDCHCNFETFFTYITCTFNMCESYFNSAMLYENLKFVGGKSHFYTMTVGKTVFAEYERFIEVSQGHDISIQTMNMNQLSVDGNGIFIYARYSNVRFASGPPFVIYRRFNQGFNLNVSNLYIGKIYTDPTLSSMFYVTPYDTLWSNVFIGDSVFRGQS